MTFAGYWKDELKEATWPRYGSVPPVWIIGITSKRLNAQYGIGLRSASQDYDSDHNSNVIYTTQYGEFVLYERTQAKLDNLEDDLREIIKLSNDSTMLMSAQVVEDLDRPAHFQLIISAQRLEV